MHHDLHLLVVAQRPVQLPRSKKRARRRLKAWMRACAPNVLNAVRLSICRHKAEWAAAGTLPSSHATITGPWRTRRIFANCLQGTNYRPLNLRFWKFPQKRITFTFFGRRRKSKFLTHAVLSGNCHRLLKLTLA